MKDFESYRMASITEECRQKITELEYEIKNNYGNEVVLIAYQERESKTNA